jgi:hypothetical protein
VPLAVPVVVEVAAGGAVLGDTATVVDGGDTDVTDGTATFFELAEPQPARANTTAMATVDSEIIMRGVVWRRITRTS